MKINVLSDLHLGSAGMDRPGNDADVVVLAGDIACPREAADWAMRFDTPVLYVPGNHEFHGSSLDEAVAELKALCAGTHVQVLDCGEARVGRVRFLGATLWTDFALFGTGEAQAAAMREAQRFVRDFSRIRAGRGADAAFTPEHAVQHFHRHAAWLDARLAAPHDGPTVVVTHHAPCPLSIHARFAGAPINAGFVSDARHLLDGRARLWIHGHTHDSFDYRVGGTRVVCNPRGYAKDGVNENARFDPDLIVEVG